MDMGRHVLKYLALCTCFLFHALLKEVRRTVLSGHFIVSYEICIHDSH